jgi:hypothetical protein
MEIDLTALTSVIGLLVSVGGLLLAYIKYIRDQEKRIAVLEAKSKNFAAISAKIDLLVASEEDKGERIKALETKMELWWTAIQSTVVRMLKHPTQKRRDLLFDKLEANTISLDELAELKGLLQCESKKKDALVAAMAIARIDTLIFDMKRMLTKTLPHPVQTQMVVQGPQGVQGVQGIQGVQGVKGEKGERG